MKVKKRVLSAVLAATMLVTSLSAGLSALAAETNADPYQTLIEALQADGVKNASWGSPQNYMTVVNDPTGDIEKAAEAFWEVATAEASNGHTGENKDDANRTAYGVKEAVRLKLQNDFGMSGEDLAAANSVLTAFVGGMSGTNSNWSNTSWPSLGERTYGIRIVRDIDRVLLAQDADVDKLPDTLYTSIEYTWEHGEARWNSGLFNVTKNVANYLKENGWKRTETGENTEIPAALKAFDAFFNEHLDDDLDALTGDELQALRADAQAQVDALNALNLWGNDDIMNHFFDKDAIQGFIYNVQSRIDVAYAREYVAQFQELMANDPAEMEHDALTQLYTQLTDLRTSLQGLTTDAQNTALAEASLTWDAINAYIASVNEEIEVDNLEGYKSAVEAVIAGMPEDLTTATDDQLTSALAQAQQQWALISACTQGAIDRVFTDGTAYVTEFIRNVQVETDVRELETGIADFGAYFAVHMATDLTTVTTDDLINNYRTPDRAQFEAMQAYAVEALDRVYGDGFYASVEAYIASIDATLTARVEAQIDEAVNNYQEFGQITIRNYRAVKDAIGGVETGIIDLLGLSEEYQAKYDQFSAYSEELKAFEESKGLSNWTKPEVEYPTRESMPGDIARTPEETYEVTPEKLNQVISSVDGLMTNPDLTSLLSGLGISGLEGTISDLIMGAVSDNLYTDAMVNTLVTGVYGMLADALENLDLGDMSWVESVLKLLGYDNLVELIQALGIAIYPNEVASYLNGDLYPEAKAAMQAAGSDWSAYNTTVTWHVTDKDSFVQAASYALCGLQEVLEVVLTNKAFDNSIEPIGGTKAIVHLNAMNLYNDAVLPLLELLGCENLMSTDQYNQGQYSKDLLPPILNPLLDFVEELANAPVGTLLDLLPKLAYVMEFDMLRAKLQNVTITGSLKITTLWGAVTAYTLDLGSTVSDALGSNNLYGILTSETLGLNLDPAIFSDVNALIKMVLGLVAPNANLVLPTIDQAYLASLGMLNENVASGRTGGLRTEYVSDKPAVLLAVLRYVLPMLGDQDFMDSLFALIGTMTGSEIVLSDDIMNILKGLGSNPDGVICALTELFVPQEYAAKQYTYKYVNEDPETELQPVNTVAYSENWTKEEAQYIADNLDEFVDNMMTILGGADMSGLGDLIRSYIADEFYTNEMINTLVLTVKELLDSIGLDLAPILALVDIDLSSWDNVTAETDWGVITGDSASFAAGLSKALAPVVPVLAIVLTDRDLSILGTVTANGYPGYQTGIIPLLENLGCNPDDILTYDEYVAAVAEDQSMALNAILTPILNLVDRIYENPIDTIIDILPNLLYFIDCGGLQTAVENTAKAAFVLLDTVRPVYNISFDLNLNLQQIILDLLANIEVNGQKLNLKIPFLNDLSMLMVGTVTPYDSKSDLEPCYMLMNTDKADFVTVLMRNVVDLIFYEENQKVITDLIANQVGLDQKTADSLLEILNTFGEMYKERNGVDKILHAAYVIFKGADQVTGGSIAAIKDFNERWSAVFDQMYQSGGFLKDFAEWADETLDFLSFGAINGDGIGTSGLVDFFQRLAAFFQGKITDVSINRTSADLLVGGQVTLSLSFKPVTVKNKNVTWDSSKPSVATVENGVVTAVGVGDAEIMATTEDGGFTVSCVVRVRADKAELNAAIARVEGTTLTEEQQAQIGDELANAKEVVANEFASQATVDAACEALLDAFNALDLGTPVTDVTVTQNGAPVGEVVYQKVKWTKKWNSTPVTLGVQINGGELKQEDVKSVTWQYADWSADKPEADIEPNGMEAVIRAKNSVIGAHSCWIQVTVEDVYGNTVTSNPVKVRFYNYDWQK